MTLPTASHGSLSPVLGHDGAGVRDVLPSVFAGVAEAPAAPISAHRATRPERGGERQAGRTSGTCRGNDHRISQNTYSHGGFRFLQPLRSLGRVGRTAVDCPRRACNRGIRARARVLGGSPGRRRRRPRGRRGRDLRLPRPERRRKDDHGAHADHAAAPDRAAARGSPGYDVVAEAGERAAVDRRRPPGGGARPADDRPRADPPPGDAPRAHRRRGRAPLRRADRAGRAQPAPPTAASAPTPAACAGASTSPRRWSTSRRSCSSTSRRPGSTRSAARRSGRRSRRSTREGTTVFLTTQYLEEADQLANRVGIINGGKIVAEGTPASLKAEVGKAHLEIGLVDGSPTQPRAGRAAVRPDPAAARRQAARRARRRRRRRRQGRPRARRGRDPGRLARAGRADPRRRLRRQDRRAHRRQRRRPRLRGRRALS